MQNNLTKIAPEYNAYVPNAKLIEEFFGWFDGAVSINELLWDMFEGSITNPACPTEHTENGHRSFLYKRLTELMTALEPPKRIRKSDLNDN